MTEVDAALSEEEYDEPLRWYAVAAFVVVVVAGFALGLYFFLSWTSICADKSLGNSVAADSTRGALCHSGHGAAVLVIPAGWVAGLALASYALLRWGGGALRAALCAVLLLAPAVLPAAAYGALRLSDATCSGHELAAYRAWADRGSKGAAPYDCRTY